MTHEGGGENPLPKEPGFTRRNLLKAAAGGLMASILPRHVTATELPTDETQATREAVQEILTLEDQLKDEPLSIEQAEALAKPMFTIYRATVQSGLTPESFTKAFYVLQKATPSLADDMTDAELALPNGDSLRSHTIRDFMNRYPQAYLSKIQATNLLEKIYGENQALGVTSSGGMYINLDRINTVNDRTDMQFLQFSGKGNRVACERRTPFVTFLSVGWHEGGHFDTQEKNSGRDRGFASTRQNTGMLEELAADYIAIAVSQAHGLPYGPNYELSPLDHDNFSRILEATDLSLADFSAMHRRTQLDQFLHALAVSARKHAGTETDLRVLKDTIVKRFSSGEKHHPDWQSMQQYFPTIDATDYIYSVDPTQNDEQNAQGCLLPDLLNPA